MVSLAVAILATYQVLAWVLRFEGAAPIVDLLGLALVVVSVLVTGSAHPAPACDQNTAFVIIQALFLMGTASAAIIGCSGVLLGLVAGLGKRSQRLPWPSRSDLTHFLAQTNILSLLILGFGLLLGIFWSWQTTGSLGSSDSRMAWMASAWLLAAMTNLAQGLQRHWLAWLAILAVATAGAALWGLLVHPFLPGQL